MKLKSGDSQALPTIAIVGGGASGVLAAVRLLESPAAKAGKIRIVLAEKSGSAGRGVAYGTEAPFHLLNVRQNRMSAYAEDPDHFARWIARTYPGEMKTAFQPRRHFARYLAALLAEARRGVPAGSFFAVNAEVLSFARLPSGKIELRTTNGDPILADRVVLATGHRAPGTPPGLAAIRASARYHADPWSRPLDGIGKNERILVVGTGLTAVDFVLSRMRAGQLAPIDLVSRRGLAPLAHPRAATDIALETPFADESVRGVVRALRSAARAVGDRWPDVVDRFRSEVHRIWGAWPDRERRRFLRHACVYWETHRHRVAPDVHREWDLYRRGGKSRIMAGRILGASEGGDGILVRVADRSGVVRENRYDRIVNCTGATPDLALLEGHGYRADPLGVGIPTDSAGRPLRADGVADPAIFVLGPALRTRFWEMTAVPDLRVQAKIVVEALLGGLSSGEPTYGH